MMMIMVMMMITIILILIIKCPERLLGPLSLPSNASPVYVNLGVEGKERGVSDVL